jgi:tetratricopeptide (TPR) repeat protein
MFTINIYLKFALIAFFLGGGVVLSVLFGFWYAFVLLLIGITLLVSYIMLGTIQSAAQMLQVSDFDGAEKRLALTLTPKLLYVTNRAFYYIIKGSIALNNKDNNLAEELFNTALALKLPTDNEKAMILLQLANINAVKNKWTAAKQYFKDAKKLKVSEGAIKEQMNQFEKALNNRGQQKAMMGRGGKGGQAMVPGGKRRRPKMR